jgi:hypothetical protein
MVWFKEMHILNESEYRFNESEHRFNESEYRSNDQLFKYKRQLPATSKSQVPRMTLWWNWIPI